MRNVSLVCFLLLACASFAADPEPRYEVAWPDGTRTLARRLGLWDSDHLVPAPDEQPFDPANPPLWLRDRLAVPAEPAPAFVEWFGGDLLPGTVLGYRDRQGAAFERVCRHLVVELDRRLEPDGKRKLVRVTPRWMRRIVWQRQGSPAYVPGTYRLRNGREGSYQSLRWDEDSLHLLRDDAIEHFPLAELAELHLPLGDPAEHFLRPLAALGPSETTRLLTIETLGGLRLTVTAAWTRPPVLPGSGVMGRPLWLQPAWSLDPFLVRPNDVVLWLSHLPHLVPLSRFEPIAGLHRGAFVPAQPWQRDRSVHGRTLTSGGQEFVSGFGVRAHHELEFALPAFVRSVRTRVGLDALAYDGGCVRVRLLAGGDSGAKKPLFESPPLIGSTQVLDTGPLALQPESRRLTLVADMAHEGRPTGADPFDVRDLCNWLEPTLELDAVALQAALRQHAAESVPAWDGWVASDPVRSLSRWDEDDSRFVPETAPTGESIALRQSLRLERDARFLLLHVSRAPASNASRIRVLADDEPLAEFDVPPRPPRDDPDPLLVPLDNLPRNRPVAFRIEQVATGAQSFVAWRDIRPVTARPGLTRLFEDELTGPAAAWARTTAKSSPQSAEPNYRPAKDEERREPSGPVSLVADAFSGTHALRVGTEASPAAARGWQLPIARVPRLGQYRFLRLAWRKEGGTQIVLTVVAGERELSYRPGIAPAPGVPALAEAAAGWRLETRDLFEDFGQKEVTLTGLTFESIDGQAACFDHIYVARNLRDFDHAPAAKVPHTDEQLLRRGWGMEAHAEMSRQISPDFNTNVPTRAHTMSLFARLSGRTAVVETASGQVFARQLTIPAGLRTRLEMLVGHRGAAWKLQVKADGEMLHDSTIEPTMPVWRPVSIDLTRFAGKQIMLEPSGPAGGYWADLRVVSE